jgi:hypothetical protein
MRDAPPKPAMWVANCLYAPSHDALGSTPARPDLPLLIDLYMVAPGRYSAGPATMLSNLGRDRHVFGRQASRGFGRG